MALGTCGLLTVTSCQKRVETLRGPGPRSAGELLERTREIEQFIVNLRGQARVQISSKRARGNSTALVAVQRPASMHLELLDFFGKPQSVLVSDGKLFGLFHSTEGKFYRGPATAANMARFFSVPIAPQVLVKILLGEAPRVDDPESKMLFNPEAGDYELELRGAREAQHLRISGSSYRVIHSDAQGPLSYSLEFAEFLSPPSNFPRRIAIELPSTPASVEVRYTDITLNDSLDQNLFRISPPRDAKVIEVDDVGNAVSQSDVEVPLPGAIR